MKYPENLIYIFNATFSNLTDFRAAALSCQIGQDIQVQSRSGAPDFINIAQNYNEVESFHGEKKIIINPVTSYYN